MGLRERNKGKVGERELRDELNRLLGTSCRRGQQFCGSSGDADVVGVPGVHVECKRVEKLNIHEAMEQAVADARNFATPVVCHRRNNKPWLITMRLDDMVAFSKNIVRLLTIYGRLSADQQGDVA